MATIAIGDIRCNQGNKASGYVSAVNRIDGSSIGIPVVVVAGKTDGPVLLVDGGIHGDEPEGTLAILELARELDPQALSGVFIGVPVINVGAFEAMSRGNPRDTHSYDMNRIYPGREAGFLTERIAQTHHREIASLADMEITCHSGGNICYLAETIFVKSDDKASEELARAMGPDWPIIFETPRPVGSPLAAMTERGKPALTIELGGAAGSMPDFLCRDVATIKGGLVNVCRHYGLLDGTALYADGYWRGKQRVVQASKSGLINPIPERRLKKPISKGEVMMRTTDLLGTLVEELRAPCDGTIFGIRTYPSVSAGDWTLFCGDATFEKVGN